MKSLINILLFSGLISFNDGSIIAFRCYHCGEKRNYDLPDDPCLNSPGTIAECFEDQTICFNMTISYNGTSREFRGCGDISERPSRAENDSCQKFLYDLADNAEIENCTFCEGSLCNGGPSKSISSSNDYSHTTDLHLFLIIGGSLVLILTLLIIPYRYRRHIQRKKDFHKGYANKIWVNAVKLKEREAVEKFMPKDSKVIADTILNAKCNSDI